MKYHLAAWKAETGWVRRGGAVDLACADLVLYFGNRHLLGNGEIYHSLRAMHPESCLLGCSTGGEILGTEINDETVVAAAIAFEGTRLRAKTIVGVDHPDRSYDCGRTLAEGLAGAGLRHVFILSDGIHINGTALLRGLSEVLGDEVVVTGGLAGDGDRFQTTLVGCDAPPAEGVVAAVGFYGDRLVVRHGCRGGWDRFGPERRITRAEGNVLYELDGQPALALYKRYLGEEARDLPGSALLFPLAVRWPGGGGEVVRTIVGIDEERQGMIFAGEIGTGQVAHLMKGNFDRLVEGAEEAARLAIGDGLSGPALAVLISCIGRKLLLGQRTCDEVEATKAFLGEGVGQIGFYSYGEISPQVENATCELHNQTMTITVLTEL
jgi:hypothetical protein